MTYKSSYNMRPSMMVCTRRAFAIIILIIWDSICMGHCGLKRKLDHTNNAGYTVSSMQPIAVDELLKIYENEHYNLHMTEGNKNNVMEWPFLEKKNLDECCFKYLKNIIPSIKIDGVTGTITNATLRYVKKIFQDFCIMNKIVIIKCERWNVKSKFYYMARAPELDCFYALLRNLGRGNSYIIINKHCGFEWPTDNTESVTGQDKKIIKKLHRSTGQPIAKQEYLCKYEQEHQRLSKTEANQSSGPLPWPYILEKENLDEYCSQYLKRCNPRKTGTIQGMRIVGNLWYPNSHYEKKIIVKITALKCVVTKLDQWFYILTRAPTDDCVYALISRTHNDNPYEIIFKHCDFEFIEEKAIVSESSALSELNSLPKNQIKEERSDILGTSIETLNYMIKQEISESMETLQLFPCD